MTARVPDLPDAVLALVPRDGGLVLAEVRVFPRERDDAVGDAAAQGSWTGRAEVVPPGGMAARLLRELRPGEAAREALRSSGRTFAIDAAIVLSGSARPATDTGIYWSDGLTPPMTIEQRLSRVAVHYAQARLYGSRRPSRDAAELLGVTPEKVREDLRAARRAGLLASTKRGMSGGEMTPKGNAVLTQMIGQRLEFLDQAFESTGRPHDLPFDGSKEDMAELMKALHWLGIDWVSLGGPDPHGSGKPEIMISWDG